jgi:hypothetical protein
VVEEDDEEEEEEEAGTRGSNDREIKPEER